MTAHWSDDPADDFAWNNYSAGWELAVEHHATGTRAEGWEPASPFGEGYRDGWAVATTTERNTP